MSTFEIKRNDLQPIYSAAVTDSTGTAISIAGATIRCNMKLDGSTALKIDRQTAGITITNGAGGLFTYTWQAGDTDTSGTYVIEFEVTPDSGGKFTVPSKSDEKAYVSIWSDFDAT